MTSSCGRLFDAVSALLGLRDAMTFEGEPAIALEMCLPDDAPTEPYPFGLTDRDGVLVIETRPLMRRFVEDILQHVPAPAVSLRFHSTVVAMFAEAAARLAREYDVTDVTLGGGVFNNAFVLREMTAALESRGLTARRPLGMPPGDGCISLGQLAIAGELLRKGGI